MTFKILLTGRTGQVGAELHRMLPKCGEVIAPDRKELDLSNEESIRRLIRETRPHLIVNAAAYTAVDAAETDEVNAFAVNAVGPATLADEAKKNGAELIHFSTDYVFDGSKKTPYEETDLVNPINVYGKSKLAGEQAIRGSGVPYLILRTAWVYANRGRNFLLTILRLATEREELKIVCDQIGAPTCAFDIASATTDIIAKTLARRIGSPGSPITAAGTYHLTAAGETTWFDFAKAILDEAVQIPKNVPWFALATGGRHLIVRRVIPIQAAEYGSRTPRPAYSVLSNSRLREAFGVAPPHWRTQLHRCFAGVSPASVAHF